MSSKRYVWTLNNPTEQERANIHQAAEDRTNIVYLVYGNETAPTTGTPHLQGFVILTRKSRLPAAKRAIGCDRVHLEPARGTDKQASDYAKKDGQFVEFGNVPADPGTIGKLAEQKRWDDARTAAQEGRFQDIPSDIYVRYFGNIKKIFNEAQKIPESTEMNFHWYYGETGTGKSTKARTENPNYYLKGINKWWDGYENQPCVIIEEWGPLDNTYEKIMGHYLKQWCDHHPFQAEYKGGMKMIRPPKIIITSNYALEDCFHDMNILAPLRRRLRIHHFIIPFSNMNITTSPTQENI